MEKIVKIGEKEVTLKCNAMFPIIYKQYFKSDILTVVMPLISEILQNADELFKGLSKDKKEKNKWNITPSAIGELLEGVYSLELVDLLQIIWTTAKIGDSTIKPMDNWLEEFDEFPIMEVAAEAIMVILPSLISKKKLEEVQKTYLQTV